MQKPYWWQWPTVLSLDAPAVTLLWQWLLARPAHVALGWQHNFVLGTSVWLAYVADRWIEGWRLAVGQVRTERHSFYKRWRWPIATSWLLGLGADLAIALTRLTNRELEAGLLLLMPVLAYLLSHQLIHRRNEWRAPKEVCIAALLGGGAAVFIVAQPTVMLHPLIVPLALFMLLCFVNCALISAWEHEVDQMHGQTSFALQFHRGMAFSRMLPWISTCLAVFLLWTEDGAVRVPIACGGASSIFLGVIDSFEPRFGRRLARVLADLAMMTPIVPLIDAWTR